MKFELHDRSIFVRVVPAVLVWYIDQVLTQCFDRLQQQQQPAMNQPPPPGSYESSGP